VEVEQKAHLQQVLVILPLQILHKVILVEQQKVEVVEPLKLVLMELAEEEVQEHQTIF
tara:strand:+ start:305 stop:478 length:174 start_codon:yes stop_codon:yes gene_type:complete